MSVDPRFVRLQEIGRDPARHAELLDALEHPELAIRRMAVAVAARYMSPDRLLPLLRNEGNAAQRSAARSVLKRQVPASFGAARVALGDPDPDVVIIAIEILAEDRSAESFALIQPMMEHPDTNIAVAATEAVGHFDKDRALEPLVRGLSRDTWRKMAAISALGTLGCGEAVPSLLACLGDKPFRDMTVAALSGFASYEAFAAVWGLLEAPQPRRSVSRVLVAMLRIVDRMEDVSQVLDMLAQELGSELGAALAELAGSEDADIRAGALLRLAAARPKEWLERAVTCRRLREHSGGVRAVLGKVAERHYRVLLESGDAACRRATFEFAPNAPLSHELPGALRDPDAGVRASACVVLANRGQAYAAGQLVELLLSGLSSGQERESIAAALRALGDGAAPAVEAALGRALSDEQRALLLSCAPVGALSTIPANALHAWSRLSHTGLRLQTVVAASRLQSPEAQEIVLGSLNDSDPHVSAQAAQALARSGRLTELLAALQRPSLSRFRTISALAQSGLEQAVGPLIALFAIAPAHEQVEIVASLGRIGGSAAIEFLGSISGDSEPAIRRAVAEALATRASPADEEKLIGLSQDPEWSVRRWAVDGLARVQTARARAAIEDLMRDVDDGVALAARQAYRERGARVP